MAFRYTREIIVEGWRDWFRTRKEDAEYQRKILDEFTKLGERGQWERGDQDIAAEMLDVSMETLRRHVRMAQSECPIGFFKPSWEQAQVLNAWSPEFEPEIAPNGYRSVCNFSANRTLKTTGSVIDTLLWFLPNDPNWVMFEEHEDEEGKKHGNDRGPYRVFRRPQWTAWRRTGRLRYSDDEPPMEAAQTWHGVQDDDHWQKKVGQEYQKWIPRAAIGRRPDGGTAVFKADRMLQTIYGHSIIGKTYNSDIQAWAGDAVWRINADEGFEYWLFNEMMMRLKGGGYFHWAYTAAEPRNIGQRAKLASDCFKGKHKLVGQAKFFTKFELSYVPEWAMDPDKKADDLARLQHEGQEGKIRMCGGFFDSSPVVFSNFDRERNVLPIDGSDALLAMRGEVPQRWREEFGNVRADRLQFAFYQANIIRGMDEGLANPTACVWQAILRTGEYVQFREWEESGLSVGERCKSIIERSGNEPELMNPGAVEERRRYKERRPRGIDGQPVGGMTIRRTFADSKMFKRNPEMPQDDWCEVYRKSGLSIERATNIGPAARCDYVNDALRADPTRQHLLDTNKPGARLYVTRDCAKTIERFENYLWAQIASGQRAGEFTDKPENKDDHTIDAVAYATCSKLRWKDPTPQAQEAVRVDSATGYVSR